jgi:hypothetical protein
MRSRPPGLPGRDCGKRKAGETKHRRHQPSYPVLGDSLACVSHDDRARRTICFPVADGCLPGDEGAVGGDPLRIGVADMGRPEMAMVGTAPSSSTALIGTGTRRTLSPTIRDAMNS